MSWNDGPVSDTVIAHKKGILLQTGRQLRDNLAAALQGLTGAPPMEAAWHPYNLANVGDGNDGVVWDFAVDGVVAAITPPDFVDGYEYRLLGLEIEDNSGSAVAADFNLTLVRETDGNTVQTAATVNGQDASMIDIILRNPRTASTSYFVNSMYRRAGQASPTMVNLGYSAPTVQKIDRVTVGIVGRSFGAGKLILLRRRIYY